MSRFLIVLFGLISVVSLTAQPQDYCGTQGVDKEWIDYLKKKHKGAIHYRDCQVYVAITVHVLGDDNGVGYHPFSSIYGSLETLNKDFEEAGITFFLNGPINFINNTKWYDHKDFNVGSQMMRSSNVANTVNCYIVETAANNCGYRAYNGNAIALAKSCTKPKDHTWAHEMGHWLGLPHTFYGWEGKEYDAEEETPSTVGSRSVELVNGTNCSSAADKVCDTKPDYLSYRWQCDGNNESQDSLVDPKGVKFKVDGTLIMSYANDRCQSRFSADQQSNMCSYLSEVAPEVVSDNEPLPKIDPLQTSLIYPIQGETVEGEINLKWEENGNATYYIVEVSRFPNMGILSLKELVYGNNLKVFGLSENKSYYWRVRPLNEYDFNYKNRTSTEKFKTGKLSSTDDYYAEHLRIYPNPLEFGGVLNVKLDAQIAEQVNFKITNLSGQIMLSEPILLSNGKNSIQLDVASLSPGVYILNCVGELHSFQKKIIIQ